MISSEQSQKWKKQERSVCAEQKSQGSKVTISKPKNKMSISFAPQWTLMMFDDLADDLAFRKTKAPSFPLVIGLYTL
jgi:hypothetical protein